MWKYFESSYVYQNNNSYLDLADISSNISSSHFGWNSYKSNQLNFTSKPVQDTNFHLETTKKNYEFQMNFPDFFIKMLRICIGWNSETHMLNTIYSR